MDWLLEVWNEFLLLAARPFEIVMDVVGIGENAKAFTELKLWEIAVALGIFYVIYLLIKAMVKSIKGGTSVLAKGWRKVYKSPKQRASKMVCLHCGRTLDKCVCKENEGVSLRKRIKKHKKELREIAKAKKTKAKQ